MAEVISKIVTECWFILVEMAPYLLFGCLVAGLLSVFVSPEWVERHLGKRGWQPVLTASLFGVPLPLCSCGVIPVSASLRRHGASRAATTAFLLSTPQTGVDSIAVTYGMLGPVFAFFRPLAALVTGLIGGAVVRLFVENDEASPIGDAPSPECHDDCCSTDPKEPAWRRVLTYGFVTLPRDIGLALLIGVIVAGILAVLVPKDQLNAYVGGGLVSILLLMLAGVPIYVCATASVPIAAGFMHLGASPGAALAFLISGPATNGATLATIWKVLGRRTAIIYLVTVAFSAVGFGLLLDSILPELATPLSAMRHHSHGIAQAGWLAQSLGVLFVLVLLNSYRERFHHPVDSDSEPTSRKDANQQTVTLTITGMRCTHCSQTVRRSLMSRPEIEQATVDLAAGSATIIGNELNENDLIATVEALGYSARAKEDGPA